jgi:integrase
MRAQLIRERDLSLAGLATVEGMSTRLSEIQGAYVHDLGPQVTTRHHQGVKSRLDRVIEALRDPRVRDIRPLEVMTFRNSLLSEGLSNRTANLHVNNLRTMLGWAVRAGLIAQNPLAGFKGLPEREANSKRRRRAMSESEIDLFIAAVRQDDAANDKFLRRRRRNIYPMRRARQRIPQAPFFIAFLSTGARYGELRQVRWSDIDLDERLMYLRAENTKAGRARTIPMLAELVTELRPLRDLHARMLGREVSAQDHVFLSPEGSVWSQPTNNLARVFHRTLETAGIHRVDDRGFVLDLHSLRHTYGTRLSRWAVGLTQAQKLMGHSDPKLTAKVYTHLEVQDLRATMDEVERRRVRMQSKAQ